MIQVLTSEFLLLLYENQVIFLFIFIFVLAFYFIILRKCIDNIFDPLLLSSFFSVFASTVVLFLYFTGQISNHLFWHFLATQVLFLLALRLFSRVSPKSLARQQSLEVTPNLLKRLYPTYLFISAFHIFTNYFLFIKFGFPIFLESRLDFFHASPGLGIFNRAFDVSLPLTFILSVLFISNWKQESRARKFLHSLILLLNIFICILSGSKGAFLIFIFSAYYIKIFFPPLKQHKSSEKKIKIISMLGAATLPLIILYISATNENPFTGLIKRIAFSGDIFIYGYPNNVIEFIPRPTSIISTFFQDLMGLARVKPWSEFPLPLGAAIYRFHVDTEFIVGPNPRHNIFGLYLFGPYLSLFYSFSLGALLGYCRRRMIYSSTKNMFLKFFSILVLISIPSIDTDIQYILATLNDYMIFFPILFIIPILITDYFTIPYRELNYPINTYSTDNHAN